MKFNKKLSLIVAMSLFITLLGHSGIANATTGPNKFDSKVNSHIAQLEDNNKMRVCIWLNKYTDKELSDRLLAEYNLKLSDYDDYNEFVKRIYIPTANEVVKIVGKEKAYAIGEEARIDSRLKDMLKQKGLYESEDISVPLVKRAAAIKSDYYNEARKKILESICKQKVDFVKESLNLKQTVFEGEIVPMIIADVTKEQLFTLNKLDIVSEVSYYEEDDVQNDLNICLPQIHADTSTGTNSSSYNLSGSGVKIGILEYSSNGTTGRFDATCPHLSSIPSTRLSYVYNQRSDGTYVPSSVGSHATLVTCAVVGQLYGGRQGVVPNATVYQTTYTTYADFCTGLNVLRNKGVSIITHSASSDNSSYNIRDQYVDEFVESSKITFLNSVGNFGNDSNNVGSPAKAYNAIAVGNLKTKTSSNVAASIPYSVAPTSSTYTLSYLANKPDVVAPGSYVSYISQSPNTVSSSSGTSFSTPITAGVAAQIMQRDPTLKFQPNCIKNYIIVGASNNNITNTTPAYGVLKEESGAGLINALKSVNASDLYFTNSAGGVYYYSSGNSWNNDASIYLSSGQKVRIVLTYQKEENIAITSNYGNDMDIRLVYNNVSKASSSSPNNNVEIVEYTATTSGTYTIQTRLYSSILTSSGNADLHYYISWLIE